MNLICLTYNTELHCETVPAVCCLPKDLLVPGNSGSVSSTCSNIKTKNPMSQHNLGKTQNLTFPIHFLLNVYWFGFRQTHEHKNSWTMPGLNFQTQPSTHPLVSSTLLMVATKVYNRTEDFPLPIVIIPVINNCSVTHITDMNGGGQQASYPASNTKL